MSKSGLLVLTSVLALTGCVTPFRAPPDVAHIELRVADSSVVTVPKIWLERKKGGGPLVIRGYVGKRIDATDTTGTHLDVILYDGAGLVLRQTVEQFEPRQIPRRRRMPDSASYRVVLDPLPAGTARIEVRAHEGPH